MPARAPTPSLCFVLVAALAAAPAGAQLEHGGEPPSARGEVRAPVPTFAVPRVDVDALLAEDAARGKPGPFRFGAEIGVDLGLDGSGVWETTARGDRVWRLRIRSAGAHSISLMFARYTVPDGAELFVYADGRSTVRGAYTAANNKPDGLFAVQPIAGDAVTLEYVVPRGAPARGDLRLSAVVHDYRDVLGIIRRWQSAACEIDVSCPQGAPWGNQIRSTVQVQIGGGLCTGALLNNTAANGEQLFITASHCGNLSNAIFRFKYQRPGCGTGTAPQNFTVQGSTQLAAHTGIDFRLARITESIPGSYDPYYAGWDRSGTPPANTVTVHHPQGGPKKISFDDDPPLRSGTDWRIATWELGVTEPGSSGCPLYDPLGRFIGQLWGGQAFCGFPFDDYYGRLDAAWSLVQSHLDPLGTGAIAIDGHDPAGGGAPVVSSIEPPVVQAFLPGPAWINGSGFTGATDVTVGGQSVPFTVVQGSLIRFSPPVPAALGGAPVTVSNAAGTSQPKMLTYVETSPPKVSVPGLFAAKGSLPIAWGGPAGEAYVYGVSLDPGTAVFNGFPILTGLVQVQAGTLGPIGVGPAGVTLELPAAAAGLTLLHQVWTLDLAAGLTSFQASAVAATAIQ